MYPLDFMHGALPWRASLVSCVLGTAMFGSALSAGEAEGDGSPHSDTAASAPARADEHGQEHRHHKRRMHHSVPGVVQAVLADAARTTGLAAEDLKVVSVERVTWLDGALGCPEPGLFYTQALVSGFRIRIEAGADLLDYHTDATGGIVLLCPPGRAVAPAAQSAASGPSR